MTENSPKYDGLGETPPPGFVLQCCCGSNDVRVEMNLVWSAEEGMQGTIALVCAFCGHEEEIWPE